MRITIPTLAAAISLTVFACSESPSSPSTDESLACAYSGEQFGLGSKLFVCGEVPSDSPNLQKQQTECEEDGGTLRNACPSGEKTMCIDEDEEDLLIKLYADDFTCGDWGWKNADGSISEPSSKGGACGPFRLDEGFPISTCINYQQLPTAIVRATCAYLETPFVNECPSNDVRLICYHPEEDVVYHFYGETEAFELTCESMNMEEYQ